MCGNSRSKSFVKYIKQVILLLRIYIYLAFFLLFSYWAAGVRDDEPNIKYL